MPYKGYDEKSKERTMRYIKEKRDSLNLNLPLGAKDRYKSHAAARGYRSLTALIVELLERDIAGEKSQDAPKVVDGSESRSAEAGEKVEKVAGIPAELLMRLAKVAAAEGQTVEQYIEEKVARAEMLNADFDNMKLLKMPEKS